jgi:hypothetical protein
MCAAHYGTVLLEKISSGQFHAQLHMKVVSEIWKWMGKFGMNTLKTGIDYMYWKMRADFN